METGSGYFLSFSALTHQIPTVEGKRIRCVRQKRSIRRNIELPVAIHEVHVGFGRLCSKKKHTMLLAVLIFFRNYAKIMLLSENYALCNRNYAT